MEWNAEVWCQGALMPAGVISEKWRKESSLEYYIVLSHDCDLHRNPEKEPFVELLPCHPVQEIDKSLLFAHSPRTLHLTYKVDGQGYPFALYAHEKFFVPKKDVDCSRGGCLPGLEDKMILAAWLAARYHRQALPDALNNALRPFQKFFSRQSRQLSSSIWEVRLSFDPDKELPDEDGDDTYECNFYFIYDYESAEGRNSAESLVYELEHGHGEEVSLMKRLAEGTPRVDAHFHAVDDNNFSLNMARKTVRWYYDSFSLRDGVQPPQD